MWATRKNHNTFFSESSLLNNVTNPTGAVTSPVLHKLKYCLHSVEVVSLLSKSYRGTANSMWVIAPAVTTFGEFHDVWYVKPRCFHGLKIHQETNKRNIPPPHQHIPLNEKQIHIQGFNTYANTCIHPARLLPLLHSCRLANSPTGQRRNTKLRVLPVSHTYVWQKIFTVKKRILRGRVSENSSTKTYITNKKILSTS